MGQAKQRGTKEQRINQAQKNLSETYKFKKMEKMVAEAKKYGEYETAQAMENHLNLHKKTQPIIADIFNDMYSLLKRTGGDKIYAINSLSKLHTDFNLNHTFLTSILFWYCLYKNENNRVFNTIEFCHGCKSYSLDTNNKLEFTGFGIGCTQERVTNFYHILENKLSKLNPNDLIYLETILEETENLSDNPHLFDLTPKKSTLSKKQVLAIYEKVKAINVNENMSQNSSDENEDLIHLLTIPQDIAIYLEKHNAMPMFKELAQAEYNANNPENE